MVKYVHLVVVTMTAVIFRRRGMKKKRPGNLGSDHPAKGLSSSPGVATGRQIGCGHNLFVNWFWNGAAAPSLSILLLLTTITGICIVGRDMMILIMMILLSSMALAIAMTIATLITTILLIQTTTTITVMLLMLLVLPITTTIDIAINGTSTSTVPLTHMITLATAHVACFVGLAIIMQGLM